jgi:hypothetical protein
MRALCSAFQLMLAPMTVKDMRPAASPMSVDIQRVRAKMSRVRARGTVVRSELEGNSQSAPPTISQRIQILACIQL